MEKGAKKLHISYCNVEYPGTHVELAPFIVCRDVKPRTFSFFLVGIETRYCYGLSDDRNTKTFKRKAIHILLLCFWSW